MDAKAWSISRTSFTARNSNRCATVIDLPPSVLDYGLATIAWENGVDFAPDYLYERLNAVH